MGYGIMRVEKRGRAAVYGLQLEATRDEHDRREFDASDIDWTRTSENIRLRDCREWNAEITRQIHNAGIKERKDSIVMLDGLYTASPEWFEQHSREEWLHYFQDCLEYHDRTYGRAFSAVIHLDEATPHMQVASVPLIEDEKGAHLSAKMIMGGRTDYRHRQDRFFEEVSHSRGLERGEIREPAETKAHAKVMEYKAARDAEAAERAQRIQAAAERATVTARQETEVERQRTQEVIDRRAQQIAHADQQKLEALRARDTARAEADVAERLSGLSKALRSPQRAFCQVVADHPAREAEKRLFGGDIPAKPHTVEILASDLAKVQQIAANQQRGEVIATRMETAADEMMQAAQEIRRNRMDQETIAISDKVRAVQSESRQAVLREQSRGDELERQLTATRRERDAARADAHEAHKEVNSLQQQMTEYREVLAFFPKDFDRMKERTARARRMEALYEARDSDPAWRNSWGRSYVNFEGQELGIRTFLREYLDECKKQGIPHDIGMSSHLDHLLERDRNEQEWDR